jgi:hypothetical protein
VWHSSTIILIEKITKALQKLFRHCLSKTNKTTTAKEVLRNILDCLPTDFAVFDPNHLYLNPVAIKIKNSENILSVKMILNMHTNRTDDFAIERRTKFNKAIQSKETLSWEETLCNARKKVFT